MRITTTLGIILLVTGTSAFGQPADASAASAAKYDGDHTKLLGEWHSAEGANGATWVFTPEGDDLKVTHLENGSKVAEMKCDTMGRECAFKEGGKSAKLSMYYNGPVLVQFETRGDTVVKRRFGTKGDTLELEVIPIAPPGKASTTRFSRAPTEAAQK